jgi:hypothetical protein
MPNYKIAEVELKTRLMVYFIKNIEDFQGILETKMFLWVL